MTTSAIPKKIRPSEDYGPMKDTDVLGTGRAVEASMTGNPNYSNPPIDPQKVLKVDNDNFEAGIVAAQAGGKKAVAQKNKLRQEVIKDLRVLARHVENVSNGDMAIFISSGFKPVTIVRIPQVPLSPHIRRLDHGTVTGQIIVRMKAVAGALSYELRYAPMTSGTPGNWTVQLITGVKSAITFDGLTPGTVYAFSARDMAKTGYSSWSDSVTIMCT
jgi:hypothetical protein